MQEEHDAVLQQMLSNPQSQTGNRLRLFVLNVSRPRSRQTSGAGDGQDLVMAGRSPSLTCTFSPTSGQHPQVDRAR